MKKELNNLQITSSKCDVVFHYNKAHNQDTSIPPWVVKCKGQSYYVNHMTISPSVGFSTKETPDNPHTKAALKVKGVLSIKEYDDGSIEAFVG